MKKCKLEKLANSRSTKHVIFREENGKTRLGKLISLELEKAQIIDETSMERVIVDHSSIIGKAKRAKWYPMEKTPPEGISLLLEHKSGEIKMGKLLGDSEKQFYELDEHHFHDGYWHKPIPISDFSHWCLVRPRK